MPTRSRYIRHSAPRPAHFDLPAARRVIVDVLQDNIKRVHKYPPSRSGVFIGSAGSVLMEWRLPTQFSTASESAAELYSQSLSRSPSGSHASFLETSIGLATLILVHQLRLGYPIERTGGNNSHSSARTHGSEQQPEETARSRRSSSKDWSTCAHLIKHAIRIALEEVLDDDGCEVLYGRAGLLYSLLFLRSELPPPSANPRDEDPVAKLIEPICSDDNIRALIDDIVRRGRVGAQSYVEALQGEERDRAPPLMWRWHGKRYLGAAHGVAGIIQMMIVAPPHIVAPYWELIIQTIRWLISIHQPSGNWPSKAGIGMFNGEEEEEKDQLIQWCHGAPGFCILFSTLLRRYTNPRGPDNLSIPADLLNPLRESLIRGAEIVYTKGLLRKGVGLCHGIGGNIYALLATSDALNHHSSSSSPSSSNEHHLITIGDTKLNLWLFRAIYFAQLGTAYEDLTRRGEMGTMDYPGTLYGGIGGMCCAWGEVVRRLDRVLGRDGGGKGVGEDMGVGHGVPGYDDLRELD